MQEAEGPPCSPAHAAGGLPCWGQRAGLLLALWWVKNSEGYGSCPYLSHSITHTMSDPYYYYMVARYIVQYLLKILWILIISAFYSVLLITANIYSGSAVFWPL